MQFPRLGFGFIRIGAKRSDSALGATGFFGEADAAAVVLEQVAEADTLVLWNQGCEVKFDFVEVGIFR